jgi:very-short-patch-repair endonuclease
MNALEEMFALQCEQAGFPAPLREYAAVPGRRFRWDFAWTDARVLVEINGGTYAHMGHSTGPGIARDYEKSNLAMLAGWRTFVFDRRMVEAGTALDVTAKALGIG